MLNFSVLETIQIIKRRRIHFQDVAAGLATLDDVELAVGQQLTRLQAGRGDEVDFGNTRITESAAAAAGSEEWATVAVGLIIRQLDAALAELRLCMFDGIDDEDRISSESREARASRAVAELDSRLFSVALCAPLRMKVGVASEQDVQVSAAAPDHRFNKFKLHLKLRRHPELPLADATSAISSCIPGWPSPHSPAILRPAPSQSAVPALLHAIQSPQPCIYGARRKECSTWRQKHKR
jgi:hypothetical protein